MPHVLTEDQTLETARLGRSIARFGDGELRLAVGGQSISQKADPKLAAELRNILVGPTKALVCLPRIHCDGPNDKGWLRYWEPRYSRYYGQSIYGSTHMTRPDSAPWICRQDYWDKVRSLWAGKAVTLVKGTERSLRVDMMSEAAHIDVVDGPRVDAYSVINDIEHHALLFPKEQPIILCLGAAATVLAERLARKGRHALDLGHVGMMMRRWAEGRMKPVPVGSKAVISKYMQRQNQALHDGKEKWGNDGHKRAEIVRRFIAELDAYSVLDYGCGRGTLRMALKDGGKKIKGMGWGGAVFEYDPALPKKNKPTPADIVACTDVLEHVEPDLLGNVLDHIRTLAAKGAFLLICTREANKVLPDGRNAHLIIENADWWLARVRASGLRILRHEVSGSNVLIWTATK